MVELTAINVCTTIYLLSLNACVTQVVHLLAIDNQIYHGAQGAFSIYNISVVRDQRSATDVWVRNGSGDETNILMAGSMVMHLKHYPLPNHMNI